MCRRAGIVLQHRHHLVDQLGALCQELTASPHRPAEDDSWAQGQCDAMRVKLDEGLTAARGVRAVSELLRDTRERQGTLRAEREKARESLKTLINRMLAELGELGSQTGRFHESVGRYADVIEKADSLESLAGVVREMVEETRTVQALVAADADALAGRACARQRTELARRRAGGRAQSACPARSRPTSSRRSPTGAGCCRPSRANARASSARARRWPWACSTSTTSSASTTNSATPPATRRCARSPRW